jgi:hypothetical protein
MRRQRGSIQARRGKWRISWYDVSGVRQYETWDAKQEAERELSKRIADTLQGAPATRNNRDGERHYATEVNGTSRTRL